MSATILVLEDDTTLQELLCEVLQDEGYNVIAADTLPKLLDAAPQHADLLITDLLVDFHEVGLQAIDKVRRITRPSLPALICTAAQQQIDSLQREIAQLQAQLLYKPFTIDELVDAVARALAPRTPAAAAQTNEAPQGASVLRTSFA